MKILLVGEGGQGVQLIAEVLAHAAFLEGKEASLIPNFGVEQRGGVSLAFIIVGEDASYPKFDKADILAIFCDRAWERVKNYLRKDTKVFLGPAVTRTKSSEKYFWVERRDLPSQVWNIVVLGEILNSTNLVSKKSIFQVLEEKLALKFQKDSTLRQLNVRALG